jgi:hypothetical protein
MSSERVAVVSCHVERPLDDRCWAAFSRFQASRPGGFRIAALIRPPDDRAGEELDLWLERARAAAANGPLGHHTHFVAPEHARPSGGSPEHAERVLGEAARLRGNGLEPRFFCGGGWYIDEAVAGALADLGYVDCTATAFAPAYLAPGAARLATDRPIWLELVDGRRLLELPATHSLGMAVRAALGQLPEYVHVYFHDTDLLSRRRRAALRAALATIARRCRVTDLDALRAADDRLASEPFAVAARGTAPSGA